MNAQKHVQLIVDATGEIKRVTGQNNEALTYRIVLEKSNKGHGDDEFDDDDDEQNDAVGLIANKIHGMSLHTDQLQILADLGREDHYSNAFCATSMCMVPNQMFPIGVAWALNGTKVPPRDAFPLDFACGTGVTLVEIVLPHNNFALSSGWFTAERVKNALALLKGDNTKRGLISDPDCLSFVREYTHPWSPDDPILWPYDNPEGGPDAPPWNPGVTDKDFVGIFVSTWQSVEDDILKLEAHNYAEPTHYYVAVRGGLSDEMADQLRMSVMWRAEQGETWMDVASSDEVERARAMGVFKRKHIIKHVCDAFGVVPKKHVKDENVYSNTDTNVFGIYEDDVVYYSGCSSSLDYGPGRAIFVNDGVEPPSVLWLHGPHTGVIGGGEWPSHDSGHAVTGTLATTKGDAIPSLIQNGFNIEGGFVDLQHVCTVHHGSNVPCIASE